MKQFFIAFIFYTQNIILSLFTPFIFIPSAIEFFSIVLLVFIISQTKYYKIILISWLFLYFTHFSFISFFGSTISSTDIYLFFTHISESYETFIYTVDKYLFPFMLFIIASIIILKLEIKRLKINIFILIIPLIALLTLNTDKINDSSFLLLEASYKAIYLTDTIMPIQTSLAKKPIHNSDINIVLIIGESMRAKELQTQKYQIFENYFYKTIYSGATSTDVSVPLLINGAIKPTDIDFSNNLFTLAQKNSYQTSFISSQTQKAMQYIEPYLHKKNIDNYKIMGSKDDRYLVDEFKKIYLEDNKTNFIVMQMQGEHSPYIYYENYKKSTITQQYNESMEYSNKIIIEMIEHIKTIQKETIFIFTSDHGELLGERGKTGHNKFEEEIYRVPLLIFHTLNNKIDFQAIQSHNDISILIHYLLGYSQTLNFSSKEMRVNGSMISEEDGFRLFQRKK